MAIDAQNYIIIQLWLQPQKLKVIHESPPFTKVDITFK